MQILLTSYLQTNFQTPNIRLKIRICIHPVHGTWLLTLRSVIAPLTVCVCAGHGSLHLPLTKNTPHINWQYYMTVNPLAFEIRLSELFPARLPTYLPHYTKGRIVPRRISPHSFPQSPDGVPAEFSNDPRTPHPCRWKVGICALACNPLHQQHPKYLCAQDFRKTTQNDMHIL